jgi:hypothetical protein
MSVTMTWRSMPSPGTNHCRATSLGMVGGGRSGSRWAGGVVCDAATLWVSKVLMSCGIIFGECDVRSANKTCAEQS